MIAGLDSSFDAPSAAQADAARAAAVGLWSGYLATRANVGLAAPWTQHAFENARRCGATPIAFCSGWDDPVAVREQAAAWRVRPCLDCEDGIRSFGSWTQPWLDASGAGIYGLGNVHVAGAAFHILAFYPAFGDPGATWSGVPPGTPHGWQWLGTHTEFGASVDRGWYDDWFGDDMFTDDDRAKLNAMWQAITATDAAKDDAGNPIPDHWAIGYALAHIRAVEAKVNQLLTTGVAAGLTAAEQAELDAIKAAVDRIEAALRTA